MLISAASTMEACTQRIVDHERELIAIDRRLREPGNNDREQLAARRAELFNAITREEFRLSSHGGPGQPRTADPRAEAVRRLPCGYCIDQAEGGLLRELRARVRYAHDVDRLRHNIQDVEEESWDDMEELRELHALGAHYRGELEDVQGMVEHTTRQAEAYRRTAAAQRLAWGAPF